MKTRRLMPVSVMILAGLAAGAVEYDVVKAGAAGDGTMDNTAVFQRLLDEADLAGGGVVKVPAGRYRIEGTLVIPGGVTLEGTFRAPPTDRHDPKPDFHGSVLLAYAGRGAPEGPPFIRLNGNMAALSGFIVYYPEWKESDAPPVPYPPCVLGEHYDNVAVLNCCFINPYEAIRLVGAGRHLVRNVYGYPSRRGLYVDACYDIGRVENCHFWPFGVAYAPDKPYCEWVNTQGVAFEFARTDWQYVLNTFCFGYGVGYKFSQSAHGACNGNFLGIGADCCRRPVLVEQAQDYGILITNGEFVGRWGSADSVDIEVAPEARGKVSLTNCSFWGPNDRCIWQRSPFAQVTAQACHFVQWDVGGIASPAIQLDAGKAILQGNTFGGDGLCVYVGDKVRSAIVMGNQADSGLQVDNRAGDRTVLIGNEKDPVEWTQKALAHYAVNLGAPGDSRYLRGWYGPEGDFTEEDPEKTWRWSRSSSRLLLPVRPGTPYTVTLRMQVRPWAQSEESGIYLDSKRLAPLPAEETGLVTVSLPPLKQERVQLEVRCEGWRPVDTVPGSGDTRMLGVMVHSATVRGARAGKHVFNANTGAWAE